MLPYCVNCGDVNCNGCNADPDKGTPATKKNR